MTNKKVKPTDAELEILQILWSHGPSTVRFVNDELSVDREIGYTTTLKFLQIMLEKGMVERDEKHRTHIYTAKIKEGDTQKVLLDKLLRTAFGGSASKLVMQALGSHNASQEELEEIKKLIDKIEGGKK